MANFTIPDQRTFKNTSDTSISPDVPVGSLLFAPLALSLSLSLSLCHLLGFRRLQVWHSRGVMCRCRSTTSRGTCQQHLKKNRGNNTLDLIIFNFLINLNNYIINGLMHSFTTLLNHPIHLVGQPQHSSPVQPESIGPTHSPS